MKPLTPKIKGRKPRVAILYHYMYPDDVVSALHLDGLAEDLSLMGWDVEALPCNRGCRNEKQRFASSEIHNGVRYNRVWRPQFTQKSFSGRLLNSLWMILAWSKLGMRSAKRRPDIIVIGTDPIFAVAAAIPLKYLLSQTKIVHWCFDLHPEAAFASGIVSQSSLVARAVRTVMRASYNRCSIIMDLGPCMQRLLRGYNHKAASKELTPWALIEPRGRVEPDLTTRQNLFGNATLAVLYSGNFGEAHSFLEFLSLARALRDAPEIHFCFAVRGNKANELEAAITAEDINISIAGFATPEELENRLGAADIHLASLRKEWAGIAVPSKFFGSLAIGRPVLYSGPTGSAIGQWIRKFEIGWVLSSDTRTKIAEEFRQLAKNPHAILAIQNRSQKIYKENFSRKSVTDQWHIELSKLLAEKTS